VLHENDGQPHATEDERAISFAGNAPMWRPHPAGEALSISNCERQEALSDAWGSARVGIAKGGAQRELSPRLLHRESDCRAAGFNGADS
jgi:hypothetical protein